MQYNSFYSKATVEAEADALLADAVQKGILPTLSTFTPTDRDMLQRNAFRLCDIRSEGEEMLLPIFTMDSSAVSGFVVTSARILNAFTTEDGEGDCSDAIAFANVHSANIDIETETFEIDADFEMAGAECGESVSLYSAEAAAACARLWEDVRQQLPKSPVLVALGGKATDGHLYHRLIEYAEESVEELEKAAGNTVINVAPVRGMGVSPLVELEQTCENGRYSGYRAHCHVLRPDGEIDDELLRKATKELIDSQLRERGAYRQTVVIPEYLGCKFGKKSWDVLYAILNEEFSNYTCDSSYRVMIAVTSGK